ncbi:hypothetical protein BTIS_1417 [Bifidobacterium tissieri]|uniref:Uncharacterized protein n=1 Tax=Bifidobacterium tissieri TaxID=1630162 RepID=A0A261FED1_9BIFI|nr:MULTISPECIES: hypothetical protein [Bifidobacterium]OZG57323.1 hypothetical protein BTIS_1417 [Bifidobacterium tissieri]TPF96070.1 hypothetical protein EP30_09340 [Bifidobacterium sp. UTCIF-39]
MSEIDEGYNLFVPLDAQGEQDMQYADFDTEHCATFELRQAEYNALSPLWDAYNFAFRIIIDEYEDEELPAQYIDTALTMAETALKKCTNDVERSGLHTLIDALRVAQEHHTFVELVF